MAIYLFFKLLKIYWKLQSENVYINENYTIYQFSDHFLILVNKSFQAIS
jgi:hypothetical protein